MGGGSDGMEGREVIGAGKGPSDEEDDIDTGLGTPDEGTDDGGSSFRLSGDWPFSWMDRNDYLIKEKSINYTID